MLRLPIALVAATFVFPVAAPTTAPPSAGRTFTIAAAGDVIVHQAIALAAEAHAPGPGTYDFFPLLRPVEPWIAEADFAVCHLEGTLSPTNTGLLYQRDFEYPARFNAPRETADALAAAGYDACSTASNHTLDRGFTGVRETLEVLDAAGLGHAGTARTPQERLPAFYEVRGVRVAHLAYTAGTNFNPLPTEAPWAVNVIDDAAILADARRAREQGAEFTIVSLHWGTQYSAYPDGAQQSLAATLTASPDIDLILGHHTHAVQPIARVNGKIVAYGLGDHLTNIRALPDGSRPGSEDGAIIHLTVEEQADGRFAVGAVAVTPTWVDPVTKEVLPVDHTLAHGAPNGLTPVLEASRARTLARVQPAQGEAIAASPTPWPALLCVGRVATVVGTDRPDVLVGTAGDDVIVGRSGADLVAAGAGNDLVCTGEGDDTAWGGPGGDHIAGGPGNDLLFGGDGPDLLWGEAGADRLGGGTGADTLYGGDGSDTLLGQDGDDVLAAGPGLDVLQGGGGRDALLVSSPGDLLLADAGDSCRTEGRLALCP